jgi:2-methylcitrate dehydratase PrpD
VIGYGVHLPVRDAVTVNALMIHGLDFDDTHPRGVIHATTSVLPLALGLATHRQQDGAELLAAYILGVETAIRLGAVAQGGFHQVGFHPTGLIGSFGCTLAAAYLMKLPQAQWVHAQGIALSLTGGSLEFLQDGAWTKRLHPGLAAANGITAAHLAAQGFLGPQATYEGRFGLYQSHLGPLAQQCDMAAATAGLGQVWETLNIAVKPIPACHFTHACADAASLLHPQVQGAAIRRIVARVPAGTMKTVCEPIDNKRRPANAYEAQFSIPYSVATGLRFGRFSLDALEPSAYEDPQTLALAAKVICEADPTAEFPRYFGGDVIVELEDGRTLRHHEPVNRGAEGRPISDADIIQKFHDNAARAVTRAHADHILNTVLDIEHHTAAQLSHLLGQIAHAESIAS